MIEGSTSLKYTGIARSLHWLMAVMIFGLLALGLYMHELPLSPQKLQLYSWHKWAGVTVFLLVWLRLAWRITHPAPPLPASTPPLARRLAAAGHGALYLFMILIPLSGWLMSSAKGFQTVWFGVLPIPDLLGRDAALGESLEEVHETLNVLLMIALAGHVLAALWHRFVRRDGVFERIVLSTVLTTLAAVATLMPTAAQAATYRGVVPAQSSITFQYRQMGVVMDGRFKTFSAQAALDTATPAAARGRIDIDVAGIDTGIPEADQEALGKVWFNAAAFPKASFVLQSLKPVATGRYEGTGTLTVKGRAKELRLPVAFSPQGVLTGSFVMRRADHAIGEGMWARSDVVADEVTVSFKLQLR